MDRFRRAVEGVAAAALLGPTALPVLAQGGYEEPPGLQLNQILPPALIESGHHRVLDDVRTARNALEFQVESSHGSYRVTSLPVLARRVREIGTLAQAIDDYQRSNEELADELRGVMRVGADSWVDILTSPLKSAGSIVGQFGDNVGRTFDELGGAPGETRPAGGALNVYHQMVPSDPVLASHKRNVASQLKLDVYSSNSQVQEFLETLARARAGGNRNAGLLTVSLPSDTVRQVARGGVDNQALIAVTRSTIPELYRRNEQRLADLGVSESLRNTFLTHPRLSPTHKTLIVEHLAFLDGAGSPGALIEAATDTRTEEEAIAHVESARMLALYHEQEVRLARLIAGGYVLLAVTADNVLLVVLPFDLVFWDRQAERVFGAVRTVANDRGYTGRAVLLSGVTTRRARSELENLGFTVRERYPYRLE